MNEISKSARKSLLGLVYENQAPHLASSLSIIEIVTAIISRSIKRQAELNVKDDFVLSKGHATAGFYSVLHALGILDSEKYSSFYVNGSDYYGHVSHKSSEWSSLSTGSLGHGLPFSIGLSLANSLAGETQTNSICLMSDGECDEGSVWESALIASHHGLRNLKVVIDRNRLQSLKNTEDTLTLEPLSQKWESFGWKVIKVNGHSISEITDALDFLSDKPTCIIAETTKGKGISFMENDVRWHYRAPDSTEVKMALEELRLK